MAKPRLLFACQQCAHTTPTWMGRCTACGAWNSLVEERGAPVSRSAGHARPASAVRPITEVGLGDGGEIRLRIGIGELDRVLGGGLVTGSLTLVGGDPGVGKSTLLLATLFAFASRGIRVLYVSGEESARQVRLRAERLGHMSENLYLLADTSMDAVVAAIDASEPKVLVLDSVQTMSVPELGSVPGSIGQVREVAARAMQIAKGRDIATFLIGHVTKEGGVAGPRTLEHVVDTVLYVEGESAASAGGATSLRVVRATKNRFGSTGEIGLFEMREEGLVEVPDASARLLSERLPDSAGTVVTCAMVGARPVLVEVQALVGGPVSGNPARTVVGFDRGRLSMILAVLARAGLPLHDRDVFVSVAGGLRIDEPAADLAVMMAVASSARDQPLDPDLLVFGEVGLVGEVRGVGLPHLRLREGERHGLRSAWVPLSAMDETGKIRTKGIRRVADLLD